MERENNQTTIYSERVVSDPGVYGGQPIVRGTRIPVEIVLEQLALDPDVNALFVDYPRLTREDVQACLEYARTLVQKEKRPNGLDRTDPLPQHP